MGLCSWAMEAGAVTHRIPSKAESIILEQNGMDPNSYAVTRRGEDSLQLLCYKTRDEIMIFRGDRPWPKEPEKREEEAGHELYRG